MGIFNTYLGNVLAMWATVYLGERFQIASRLLRGLHCFKLLEPSDAAAASAATAKGGSARARRSERRAVRQLVEARSGLDQLARMNLSTAGVMATENYDSFNTLVLLCLVTASNFAVDAAGALVLARAASLIPALLALGTVVGAIAVLVQVQLLSKTDSLSDKTAMAGMGALCAGLAAVALRRVPATILRFDTLAAAAQLGPALTRSLESLAPSASKEEGSKAGVHVDARMVDSVLAVVAGALSGLLLPACMRAARGLRQALFPPAWSGSVLARTTAGVLALMLGSILPGLTCLLWVQAYMNLAVVLWHEKKDLATAEPSAAERVTRAINATNEIVKRLACKVALQCLAPAAIMIACGAGLLYLAAGSGRMSEEEAANYRGLQIPPIILQVALDFIGFWTCNSYFMFNLSTLLVGADSTSLT